MSKDPIDRVMGSQRNPTFILECYAFVQSSPPNLLDSSGMKAGCILSIKQPGLGSLNYEFTTDLPVTAECFDVKLTISDCRVLGEPIIKIPVTANGCDFAFFGPIAANANMATAVCQYAGDCLTGSCVGKGLSMKKEQVLALPIPDVGIAVGQVNCIGIFLAKCQTKLDGIVGNCCESQPPQGTTDQGRNPFHRK